MAPEVTHDFATGPERGATVRPVTDPSAGAAASDDGGALARGADYGRRALEWFQSAAAPLRQLATALKVVAVVGLVAPALIVGLLLTEVWPPSLASVVVLAIVFVMLAAAPWGLLGFTGSLDALADLPGALAASPELYRQHASEITSLYRDLGDPTSGRARGVGRGVLGGGRLFWRMRKELPDVGGIVALGRLSLVLVALLGVIMTVVNLLLVPMVATGVAFHQ